MKPRASSVFFRIPALVLLVALALPASTVQAASAVLWTKDMTEEITWHKVTSLGSLLVGTKGSVQCFGSDTGKVLWSRTDLVGATADNVTEIEGTPYLYVGQNKGKIKLKTKVDALDMTTGESVWATEEFVGYTVGYVPIPHKGIVVALSQEMPSARSKLEIKAYDVATGEQQWASEFDDKVELHLSEHAGGFFARYDLSGHSQPVFDESSVYFSFDGLARFDLDTGKQLWATEYDVTAKAIKRGNADPIMDGDLIYTSARGQLRGIDKKTGEVKWISKDFGGAIAELAMVGDLLYGRLGGVFYDWQKKDWVIKKPLGIVVVDKANGEEIWRFTGAKGSITNMAVYEDLRLILVADQKNLFGVETGGEGKVKEAFKIKLEFKHKLGAAGASAKVAKGLLGGFGGMGKKGGADDRKDNPVTIKKREDGKAVVLGKQHMLSFDPGTRQIVWSTKYDAPGSAAWVTAVMGVLSALSYAEATQRAANSYRGTLTNDWANKQRFRALDDYDKVASRRFTASEATDEYSYVLTNISEGKQKGVGIVGVNLDTGLGDRKIIFDDKKPEYEVDEITGRVFHVKKGKTLTAYQVQ